MKKIVLMLAAMALVAGIAQAEMLTNPGFETGTYGPQNMPDSWYLSESTWPAQMTWLSTAGRGGGKAILLNSFSGTEWDSDLSATVSFSSETGWLGQWTGPGTVTAGSEYAFSVWAKSPTLEETAYPYGYLSWFDVSSSGITNYWITAWTNDTTASPWSVTAGDDWTFIDFGSFTAPAGATSVTFWLAGYYSNQASGGVLYDDASMIPEPVTMGLLGLGALMLRRRKK